MRRPVMRRKARKAVDLPNLNQETMSVIDQVRFSRGLAAARDSNSHYLLERTTCCGRCVVEDDELSYLFLDGTDLSKGTFNLYDPGESGPPACPLCGSVEWDLVEVAELVAVPNEWRWACS